MRFDTLKSEVPIDIYYTQIDIIDTLFSIFDYSIAKQDVFQVLNGQVFENLKIFNKFQSKIRNID